jgi:hypothetical protein
MSRPRLRFERVLEQCWGAQDPRMAGCGHLAAAGDTGPDLRRRGGVRVPDRPVAGSRHPHPRHPVGGAHTGGGRPCSAACAARARRPGGGAAAHAAGAPRATQAGGRRATAGDRVFHRCSSCPGARSAGRPASARGRSAAGGSSRTRSASGRGSGGRSRTGAGAASNDDRARPAAPAAAARAGPASARAGAAAADTGRRSSARSATRCPGRRSVAAALARAE